MNAPAAFPDESSVFHSSNDAVHNEDRLRYAAYVLVAVSALFTGLILGQLSGEGPHGSRIAWPSPVSIQSHPRSPQP